MRKKRISDQDWRSGSTSGSLLFFPPRVCAPRDNCDLCFENSVQNLLGIGRSGASPQQVRFFLGAGFFGGRHSSTNVFPLLALIVIPQLQRGKIQMDPFVACLCALTSTLLFAFALLLAPSPGSASSAGFRRPGAANARSSGFILSRRSFCGFALVAIIEKSYEWSRPALRNPGDHDRGGRCSFFGSALRLFSRPAFPGLTGFDPSVVGAKIPL
jgi:hypothetical protein